MIKQQVRNYKSVQSHVIVLQHVSATSVTIISVSCKKNKINIIIKIYDEITHCYVIFYGGSLGLKTTEPYYKFTFMFNYGPFML